MSLTNTILNEVLIKKFKMAETTLYYFRCTHRWYNPKEKATWDYPKSRQCLPLAVTEACNQQRQMDWGLLTVPDLIIWVMVIQILTSQKAILLSFFVLCIFNCVCVFIT